MASKPQQTSKYSTLTVFLTLSVLSIISTVNCKKKMSLLVLNSENWSVMLHSHPYLLVLFHSSHCATSMKLLDELKDFQKLLHFENSKVLIAGLDVYHYEPVMRQMGFPAEAERKVGIPLVGFFFDGKPHLLRKQNPNVITQLPSRSKMSESL